MATHGCLNLYESKTFDYNWGAEPAEHTHDWTKRTQLVGEQPACIRCWSTFAAAFYLDGRHMAALEWQGKSTSSAVCQQIHTLGCMWWSTSWPGKFARSWYMPTFHHFLVLIISNHFRGAFSVLQGISSWILIRKINRKPIACSCMYMIQ